MLLGVTATAGGTFAGVLVDTEPARLALVLALTVMRMMRPGMPYCRTPTPGGGTHCTLVDGAFLTVQALVVFGLILLGMYAGMALTGACLITIATIILFSKNQPRLPWEVFMLTLGSALLSAVVAGVVFVATHDHFAGM